MTAYILPAPDAPAEEWGRLAVSIPGWRWMPGMRQPAEDGGPGFARRVETVGRGAAEWHGYHGWGGYDDGYPDPDDPATAGCLLRLLGGCNVSQRVWKWKATYHLYPFTVRSMEYPVDNRRNYGQRGVGISLGRACIAAAAALGRWPGGEG